MTSTLFLAIFLALYCVNAFISNEVLRVLCAISAGVAAVLLIVKG